MDTFNRELKDILIKKAKGFYYREETIEFTENASGKKVDVVQTNDGFKVTGVKRKRGRPRKNLALPVTYLSENGKVGVNLNKAEDKKDAETIDNIVVKRKITTHYVPPDMLAIKMLIENFGEKVESIEEMSDEEILKIRANLLEELRRDYEDK